MEIRMGWIGYELGIGTSILCDKHQQKWPENEQSRENERNPQQHCHARPCVQDARLCASHQGPWWASRWARGGIYPSRSVFFFNAVFCALLVLRFGPRVLPILGHFGPPLQASLIHMASQGPFFLQLLGSSHVNLQSKLEKCRKMHNWRNRGVNHKIKYINPQEWILNTQLILAYMTGNKLPHA